MTIHITLNIMNIQSIKDKDTIASKESRKVTFKSEAIGLFKSNTQL